MDQTVFLSSEKALELESFARSTEASLDLLKAIDGTVESLQATADLTLALAKLTAAVDLRVKKIPVQIGAYIDANDNAIDALERAENLLKGRLARIALKRSAIDRDERLEEHHSEALHDAYESAMDSIAILVDEVQTLRDSIIKHDLDAEPRDGIEEYATVAELVSSLRN